MTRALLVLAFAACATNSTAPSARTSRGLRADQHLDEARAHERRADALARWPDGHATAYNADTGLWYRAFDTADEERRLATVHRGEAARLHAAYEEACTQVSPELVRVSPTQRYGTGGMPIEDGVVIFIASDAVAPDRLLAELRCHRAWMMLSNRGMEDCPLDLPGIRVQAHGDRTGTSLEIRTTDARLVPELQRRAAIDLEVAAHH